MRLTRLGCSTKLAEIKFKFNENQERDDSSSPQSPVPTTALSGPASWLLLAFFFFRVFTTIFNVIFSVEWGTRCCRLCVRAIGVCGALLNTLEWVSPGLFPVLPPSLPAPLMDCMWHVASRGGELRAELWIWKGEKFRILSRFRKGISISQYYNWQKAH